MDHVVLPSSIPGLAPLPSFPLRAGRVYWDQPSSGLEFHVGHELVDANPAGKIDWMSHLCASIPALCWQEHLEPAQLPGDGASGYLGMAATVCPMGLGVPVPG